MNKSLYIGNVEFILKAECDLRFDSCLEPYLYPVMTIEKRVLYHIRYEEVPLPTVFQPITQIDYPPHIIGKTDTGECRIYSDFITGTPKAMYRDLSDCEAEIIFYNKEPQICTISLQELNYLAMERQMLKTGSLILHSSFIEVNGKAILFTAPSGTGKSTQADLWKKYRGAEVINGDRTLLVKTKNGFAAVGFPFSGSSGIFKNKVLDISAIVMIRQAVECSGKKESQVQSFKKIYPEITRNYWNTEYEDTVIKVLNDLLSTVPTIRLDCTMGEDTVVCLEQIIAGENTDKND